MSQADQDDTDRRESQAETEAEWRRRQADIDRRETERSKQVFDANDAHAEKQLQENKKRGGADRSFAVAAEFAKRQIRSEGLEGEIRPNYEVRYTVAQGIKAAVHGREDVIATLVLQRDILVRLDKMKLLLWIIIAILGFIAYKVA